MSHIFIQLLNIYLHQNLQPAETTKYMVAGYVVIFSGLAIYLVSLVLRNRKFKQDIQSLEELDKDQ